MTGHSEDEDIYQEPGRRWSGRPNAALVHEMTGWPPGHALDLGCGEGGDAVWLARQGWTVTAADISATALERAAADAEAAGVSGRIDWQQADLVTGVPAGSYDLVSAQFLHNRGPSLGLRAGILRTAAERVAGGGILLIVGHVNVPGHLDPAEFPHPDELLASLALPEQQWEVLVAEERTRTGHGPDGRQMEFTDSVVKLRRGAGMSVGAASVSP